MRGRRGVVVAAVLAGGAAAGAGLGAGGAAPDAAATVLTGRVVDEAGSSVAGARVDLGGGRTVTADAGGRFEAELPKGPQLVSATAPGHLSRTQAVQPGGATQIVLTSQSEQTVSVRFGGDVMFGRRYLDPDEDGERSDGLLPPDASVAEHTALLEHIEPLLEDADLTVVNLESPLLTDPYVDPTAPRPDRFHPTKDLVFASATVAAQALAEAGVDAVSLGNNHVFDALAGGLQTTLAALDAAGVQHFGAGSDLDQAWAPAVVERRGQRLALLSCTTDTGSQHAIAYVADSGRAGSAPCDEARLDREVRRASAVADTVVVMIHGGEEYRAEQTPEVRRLSAVAAVAGAALVVNGHPHVVGGLDQSAGALVAESTGNLLFDQTLWPTFLSYLVRVDVRGGRPVLSTVDPLLLEGFVPRPTVGLLADAAARRAAGLVPGAARLRSPGAMVSPDPAPPVHRTQVELDDGAVARLAPGWWVDTPPSRRAGQVRLGEEQLWTGSFEDMDTDPRTPGAHHWSHGDNVRRTASAACAGSIGMELQRSPVSRRDLVLTTTHRQLVPAGAELSLLVDVRRSSPGATLELALYGATSGASTATVRVPVHAGEYGPDSCRRVRLDATLPPGTVAVQPFLRLVPPPDDVRGARLAVDDVRLVAWAPQGSSGRRYDTVEARGDTVVDLVSDGPASAPEPFVGDGGGAVTGERP